jgi:hypothetical protein
MPISAATSAISTVMNCRWWLRTRVRGNEKVLFFAIRLMMAQQGSVIRLGFKAAGLHKSRLHHVPGRRQRKRYGRAWGHRYYPHPAWLSPEFSYGLSYTSVAAHRPPRSWGRFDSLTGSKILW